MRWLASLPFLAALVATWFSRLAIPFAVWRLLATHARDDAVPEVFTPAVLALFAWRITRTRLVADILARGPRPPRRYTPRPRDEW